MRAFDRAYFESKNLLLLGGIDEAGRGALAGPVVAAAVVLGPDAAIPGLRDSKELTHAEREALYPIVYQKATAAAVGWASAREIDQINILEATRLAALRAIHALNVLPPLFITDALALPKSPIPHEPVVKADRKSQAVAAASILAKVTRDRWMLHLHDQFPQYDFARHKGYSVAAHLAAIQQYGASTIHRHSFRGADFFETEYRCSKTYHRLLDQGLPPAHAFSDLWKREGYLLPESEYLMLRNLCPKKETP